MIIADYVYSKDDLSEKQKEDVLYAIAEYILEDWEEFKPEDIKFKDKDEAIRYAYELAEKMLYSKDVQVSLSLQVDM